MKAAFLYTAKKVLIEEKNPKGGHVKLCIISTNNYRVYYA